VAYGWGEKMRLDGLFHLLVADQFCFHRREVGWRAEKLSDKPHACKKVAQSLFAS
jgi:hypothetical protein